MNLKCARRRFIIQSLAGSLALPSLSSLKAENIGSTTPLQMTTGAGVGARRFVAIGNLLGFQREKFFPQAEGKEFEKTPLLDPLWSNRKRITLYRGLDHGLRGGHFAVHTFLSGVLHHESQSRSDGNVTLDQFIADEIGRQTRFPSLTIGSEGGIHGGCQLSWTRSGVRVPPITGPSELFEKLFVSDSPEQVTLQRRQNALHASILDAVQEEVSVLEKRVDREDQRKLEEYFDSIRDVEKRLVARDRWVSQSKPTPQMERPTDRNMVEDLPLLYEMMALALQTDLTRVSTLEIGGSFLPQHLGIDHSYHGLSHHGNDEESIANLVTLEQYQIEQFSRFLSRLSQIQDGEQSLLDSTTVLFGSGMGDANSHINTDLPIVLAGGGYGRGEFRHVKQEGGSKVPLCNMFLDIAQWMGVRKDVFGNSTGVYS